MKISGLVLGLVFATVASASAGELRCTEKAETALANHRRQFAVMVKTLESIKDPQVVGKADFAELVRVSVFARDPKVEGAKFKLVRQSFEAIAKSEDVMYNVEAWKTHGFAMGVFMDELDQSWMKLKGLKGDIRMTCESR